MNILIVLVILGVAVFLFRIFFTDGGAQQYSSKPDISKKPVSEQANDKLIVISNAIHEDIRKALTGFCKMYNQEDYAALPRLYQLSSDVYAVTFPYDVGFATFCFAVNYLEYPAGIPQWRAQVRAWTTTRATDEWITDKTVNKKVMLYVAADDKEFDNVMLTTRDGIGYKLGFAGGKDVKLLTLPNQPYREPAVTLDSLTRNSFEDFE